MISCKLTRAFNIRCDNQCYLFVFRGSEQPFQCLLFQTASKSSTKFHIFDRSTRKALFSSSMVSNEPATSFSSSAGSTTTKSVSLVQRSKNFLMASSGEMSFFSVKILATTSSMKNDFGFERRVVQFCAATHVLINRMMLMAPA
jgi:hypothetical protein